MKKPIALLVAGAALAAPASAATTKTVKVTDGGFVKSLVVVHKGDTVRWTWTGKKRHQVFQTDGPGHFHSTPGIKKGGTYKHRFTKLGTYRFICSYQAGMKMTVKVIK